MKRPSSPGRQFVAGCARAGAAATTLGIASATAQDFGSPELIEAAKKEGKLVFYTAELHRGRAGDHQGLQQALPVRQGRDGARAGRSAHHARQDRGRRRQALGRRRRPFRPRPDAGRSRTCSRTTRRRTPPTICDDVLVSPKLWPRSTLGWSIAYNTELVKNPPKSWMDLTKPEYGNKQIGQVSARPAARPGRASCSSARCWARTTGRSRRRPSRCSIPPARRSRTRWCAARSRSRSLLYNIVYTKKRDGAPVEIFFPPEGVPLNSYASRRAEDGGQPERRQAVPQLVPVRGGPDLHDQGARQPHLAEEAAVLSRRATIRRWSRSGCRSSTQFEKLRSGWIEEWNKTYGYRQ